MRNGKTVLVLVEWFTDFYSPCNVNMLNNMTDIYACCSYGS